MNASQRLPAYVAFLRPPSPGTTSWALSFPDVPECQASGDDFLSVLTDGREALSAHLADTLASGDALPQPRSWEDLQGDAKKAGVHPQVVLPRVLAPKRLRVNISIGADLLRLADDWAEAHGMTRSGLIEVALVRHIGS